MINYDLMNSLSKSFFLTNIFNINFTSKNIPQNIPFKMNTKFFQHIIPGIYSKYPDRDLILKLKATKQPNFLFMKDSESVELNTTALFSFALTDFPEKNIFSFDSDISLDVQLGANYTDSSVHLMMKKIEILKMSIIETEFPSMDIEQFRDNLNFTFEIICNAANKFYLVNGIEIPTIKGLKFKKVVVQVEDDYLSITIQPDVQKSSFNWVKLN